MPPKRKMTRYRRRRRRYKRRTNVSSGRYPLYRQFQNVQSGLPIQRSARLRYSEIITMTSTSGSLASYVFRANSVFDPDFTSVGHQPMGYDQWAGMYNHYVVLGSKIVCRVVEDAAGTSTNPGIVGVFLDDDTTLPYSTPNSFIEADKGSYKLLSPISDSTSIISTSFSAKGFFNLTNVKDNLLRVGANVVSNPLESAEYQIWYATVNATTNTIAVQCTIDYIVLFNEPKAGVES